MGSDSEESTALDAVLDLALTESAETVSMETTSTETAFTESTESTEAVSDTVVEVSMDLVMVLVAVLLLSDLPPLVSPSAPKLLLLTPFAVVSKHVEKSSPFFAKPKI